MKAKLADRISVAPDVMFQVVGSDSVLLDLKSEQYFGLNDVGTRVWELIDGQTELFQIHTVLRKEYDAPSKQIEQDLLSIVDDLADAGLVLLETENGDAGLSTPIP